MTIKDRLMTRLVSVATTIVLVSLMHAAVYVAYAGDEVRMKFFSYAVLFFAIHFEEISLHAMRGVNHGRKKNEHR